MVMADFSPPLYKIVYNRDCEEVYFYVIMTNISKSRDSVLEMTLISLRAFIYLSLRAILRSFQSQSLYS